MEGNKLYSGCVTAHILNLGCTASQKDPLNMGGKTLASDTNVTRTTGNDIINVTLSYFRATFIIVEK